MIVSMCHGIRTPNLIRLIYACPNHLNTFSRSSSTTITSRSQSTASNDDHEHIDHYDIVINGGGVVGFTLLAALDKNPFFADKRILLLEQTPRKVNHEHSQVQPDPGTDLVASERKISNRVSSITLASKEFLDAKLNIWSNIASYVKECKSMHVWSDEYHKGITFTPRYVGLSDITCPYWEPNQFNDDNICYFVENHRLLSALERIVNLNRVQFGSSVTDIRNFGSFVDVHLSGTNDDGSKDGSDVHKSEKVIRTNLIVGCDGFNSIVRNKSNLKYFSHDLKQKGIVGTVEMVSDGDVHDPDDANNSAFQRFLPEDGSVIALLPISANYSSIVISTSNERADKLMNLSEDEFVNELNNLLTKKSIQTPIKATIRNAIDNVIANVPFLPKGALPGKLNVPMVASIVPSSRATFPLMFGSTLPYAVGNVAGRSGLETGRMGVLGRSGSKRGNDSNLVLIGDALHRIPPLAGQGLNLGIGDAIELSNCLSESLERGEATFSSASVSSASESASSNESLSKALDRFERRRQLKLVPMMAAVASMSQMFTCVPTSLITQFNHLNTIKNEIVKFANSK